MSGDDPLDELWSLFGSEYEEYLGAIEVILASPDAAARIDELFRAFHSIKGGSAALSLRAIEKVAHAAEDVLHKVRAGTLPLTRDVERALFAAIDELRRLETESLRARVDLPVNTALVDQLKALLAASAGQPAAGQPAGKPPPADPPKAEPAAAAPRGAGGAEGKAEAGGALVPAPAVPDTLPLTFLQDAVLSLLGGLEGDLGAAAEAFAAEAADVGQHGLAAAARRLAAAADLSETPGRVALVDLCDRLSGLERGTGEPLGVGALVGAAEPMLAALLQEVAAELKSDPANSQIWRRAVRLMSLLDMADLAEIADLAEPHLVARPDLQGEIIDLMALAGIFLETGAGVPTDEIAALRTSVYRALDLAIDVAHDSAPDGAGPDAPAAERLSPESAAVEADIQAAGLTEVVVIADLETRPAVGEALVDQLRRHRLVTSRSRLDRGEGIFEFQVGVADSLDAFLDGLREADSAGDALIEVRLLDGDGANLLTPAGTAPMADTQGQAAQTAPAAEPAPPPAPAPAPATRPAPDAQAAPPPAAAAPAAPRWSGAAESVVRVPSGAIDTIMDRIGDLRLGATRLTMAAERYRGARVRSLLDGLMERSAGSTRDDLRRVAEALSDLERGLNDALSEVDGGVRRLYQSTTALRVVSIGTLFTRLLRPVRETAQAVGKEVTLRTEGDDVQVDKATIEMLVDPLTHIVRNSIDHGIEPAEARQAAGKAAVGSIVVRARQGTQTATIEVEDDGGGIDFERVRAKAVEKQLIAPSAAAALSPQDALELIFLPGFSTRDQVSETSGRGVGMDIVATVVRKKLGGTLRIDSRRGVGTRLTIEFPISAAIQRVLSVRAGGLVVALLERAVAEIVQPSAGELQSLGGRAGMFLRGSFLPVAELAEAIGWDTPSGGGGAERAVVVVDDGRRRVGFLVDALAGRQEVYFKRMHPLLERNRLLGGIAVIGSGAPLFALDAEALIDAAQQRGPREAPPALPP